MSNLLLESTNASLRLNIVNFFAPRNLMLPCVIQVYCFGYTIRVSRSVSRFFFPGLVIASSAFLSLLRIFILRFFFVVVVVVVVL